MNRALCSIVDNLDIGRHSWPMLNYRSLALCVLLACGSSETEETTPGTTEGETSANDLVAGGGSVARIIPADEVGEQYLAYAMSGDERIAELVRCPENEAVQTGSLLRPDNMTLVFRSVEWPSWETEGDVSTLSYRVTFTVSTPARAEPLESASEGVLRLRYDEESRSHYVICPLPTEPSSADDLVNGGWTVERPRPEEE